VKLEKKLHNKKSNEKNILVKLNQYVNSRTMDIELSVFEIVIVVAVQSTLHLEMHQNKVFLFF
jgi:hypothetical protein